MQKVNVVHLLNDITEKLNRFDEQRIITIAILGHLLWFVLCNTDSPGVR
jgi:hypothetical protein